MSDNSEGAVRAFSDQAFSRGVHVGGNEPANNNGGGILADRSTSVWIGGPQPSAPTRSTPAPSVANVEPLGHNRVEGVDFDTFRGGGVMQSARDGQTMDIIRGREVGPNDFVTITTNSGREMTVRVRMAEAEGFIHKDPATGKYAESDRAAQQQVADELARLEASKREAESLKYDPAVEDAVRQIGDAMAADGLDFGQELASFIGTDGERVPAGAAQWGSQNSLDMGDEMRRYMRQMKAAVTAEVLAPAGIDPEAFVEWVKTNGLVRGRATKAALAAHHMRTLDGFKSLAREYLDTGGRARQRKR